MKIKTLSLMVLAAMLILPVANVFAEDTAAAVKEQGKAVHKGWSKGKKKGWHGVKKSGEQMKKEAKKA